MLIEMMYDIVVISFTRNVDSNLGLSISFGVLIELMHVGI